MLVAVGALGVLGCGGGGGGGGGRGGAGTGGDGGGGTQLRVSAAASLKAAFEDLGRAGGGQPPSFSFAGSDQLAAQIRAGGKPDVFAAANAKLPAQLFADGLVERPVPFARNRLVIAVPTGERGVGRTEDLAGRGVRLAVGAKDVPIGSYTRDVLGHLPTATRRAILANVRSEEPDVSGIVGKVAQKAVTAGFVYASDVKASGGKLMAVPLPQALQPEVTYAVAVVRGARSAAAARTFVKDLLGPDDQGALRRAGLLPPP